MTQQIDEIKFMSRQKVHIPWMSGQPRGYTHFFGGWKFSTVQISCLFSLILSKLGENLQNQQIVLNNIRGEN